METQIPLFTAKHIEGVPRDRPVVMLLRHAARGSLPLDDVGNAVPITDIGQRLAVQLGEMLRGRLGRLHTSPVLRCKQTAMSIQQGAATNLEIVADQFLGDPGVYVVDGERAWTNWQQRGHAGVMLHLVTSAEALPGMARPDEAAGQLVRHMLHTADNEPGLHVFVSHDSLVVATAAQLLAIPLGPAQWPAYLEGAFFWQDGAAIRVVYREHEGFCRNR